MDNKDDYVDVIVKGISEQASPEEVKSLFNQVGVVLNCRILDKRPPYQTLMGFIRYSTKAEADMAVRNFDGWLFYDEKLSVGFPLRSQQMQDRRIERNKSKKEWDASSLREDAAFESPGYNSHGSEPVGIGRGQSLTLLLNACHVSAKPLGIQISHREVQSNSTGKRTVYGASEASRSEYRKRLSPSKDEKRFNLKSGNMNTNSKNSDDKKFRSPCLPIQATDEVAPTTNFKLDLTFNFDRYVSKETACIVRAIRDTNLCVVCPSSATEQLSSFNDLIRKWAKSAVPVKDVAVNDLVCVAYDNVYFRGIVKNIQNGRALIYAIDNGNEETVPISNLLQFKDCPADILNYPAFSIPCRIAGIKPKNSAKFSEKSKSKAFEMMSDCPLFVQGIRVVQENAFNGNALLINMSSSTVSSFSNHLISLDLVSPLVEELTQESPAPCQPTVADESHGVYIDSIGRNRNQQVSKEWLNVVTLDNVSPLQFTIITEEDFDRLNEITDQLQAFYSKRRERPIEKSKLEKGLLVIAFSEEYSMFFRGCIQDLLTDEQKAAIVYIDSGKREILSYDRLFAITESFLKDPPLVLNCMLKDAPQIEYPRLVKEQMDSILPTSNISFKRINARVDELLTTDDPCIPVKAVVDVCILKQSFGSLKLRDVLNLSRYAELSNPRKPKHKAFDSPVKGTASQSNIAEDKPISSACKENDSVSEKSIVEIDVYLTEESEDEEASHDCGKLRNRVRNLEKKLNLCHKTIFELETLIKGLLLAIPVETEESASD